MTEIKETNGTEAETGIKIETGIPKVIEATGKQVVAEPGFVTIVRKTEKRAKLNSQVSQMPVKIEKDKVKKPGEIEEIILATSGAEKILFKLNVASRDDIPRGLRHETAFVPNYNLRRDAEAAKAGISEKELQSQQSGVKHAGYDMGKIPYCQVGDLFFQLKEAGWIIQDAHYKNAQESQTSKAKNKGIKTYPVYINMIPAKTGTEERLDHATFSGLVRLLYRAAIINPWDNRHLDKKSTVVNVTWPDYYHGDALPKNKLVLKN